MTRRNWWLCRQWQSKQEPAQHRVSVTAWITTIQRLQSRQEEHPRIWVPSRQPSSVWSPTNQLPWKGSSRQSCPRVSRASAEWLYSTGHWKMGAASITLRRARSTKARWRDSLFSSIITRSQTFNSITSCDATFSVASYNYVQRLIIDAIYDY